MAGMNTRQLERLRVWILCDMSFSGMSEGSARSLRTIIYVSFFLPQNAFMVELPDMDTPPDLDTPGDDEVSVYRQHWPAPYSEER